MRYVFFTSFWSHEHLTGLSDTIDEHEHRGIMGSHSNPNLENGFQVVPEKNQASEILKQPIFIPSAMNE